MRYAVEIHIAILILHATLTDVNIYQLTQLNLAQIKRNLFILPLGLLEFTFLYALNNLEDNLVPLFEVLGSQTGNHFLN